jgi:hypothetical protein
MNLRRVLAVVAVAMAGYSLFRSVQKLRRTFAEA